MGLGDLVSKVLVELKGDTSDLKAKLKELQGIEKQRAQSLISDIDATNNKWQTAIDVLGKVGLALNTLGQFTNFARSAIKAYGEHARLEAATAGINIDRLSKAFGGLITQHDLLTMAAQTQNGVLRLNQGEMETVGKAAIALKNRGFELEDAFKKLTDAAVKGKVGGLDDLGLSIKEGASKAETLKNMMTELNKVIAESGSASDNAADDIQRLANEWDNAASAAKRYMVEALKAINLKDAESKFKDAAARSGGLVFGPNGIEEVDTPLSTMLKAYDRKVAELSEHKVRQNLAAGIDRGRQNVRDSQVIEMPDMAVGRAGGRRTDTAGKQIGWERNILTDFSAKSQTDGFGLSADLLAMNDQVSDSFRTMAEDTNRSLLTVEEQYANWMSGQPTLMEKLGLADPDAWTLAISAVNAFGDAWQSSLAAIGEGNMSAATIFKKGLGAVVRGVGDQLAALGAAELIKGGAMAITLNPMAGLHLAAGGLYSAGAVAAYAAASKLGASGAGQTASAPSASGKGASASGGGAGAGASSGGSGGSGGSNGRTMVIVYGDAFANDSPRMRQVNAKRIVDAAQGGVSVDHS